MGQESQSTAPAIIAPKFKATAPSSGIWSPTNKSEPNVSESQAAESTDGAIPLPPPPPPIWTPRSAGPSPQLGGRKAEFRPVPFESPTLTRRRFTRNPSEPTSPPVQPPWAHPGFEKAPEVAAPTNSVQRIAQSFSSPNIPNINHTSKLPRSQNPTVTLLQKAREERTTKVTQADTRAQPNEIIHPIRLENSNSESDYGRSTMTEVASRQTDGVGGQTLKEGMPVVLRSEIRDDNQTKWYKKVYNTIHKAKDDDDYVTVRYKTRRGRYPYRSNGYMSEPEPNYDSDYSYRYTTLDRRRTPSAGSQYDDSRAYGTMPNPIRSGHISYRNQPGRIEDYTPGRSSVSEREKREWWDEVMDIFDGHLEQQRMATNYSQGYLSRALKEQGYESDSSLVFRKRDDATLTPLSPVEQKLAYRSVQAGGEPPLQGFRKPAPEKPKESPRRYVETDVNIHYRSPIRYEFKDPIPEEELARRQAETMKKLYQEERRRKYLQELQDMSNRRHTDTHPNQKSPVPLNRFDDFLDEDYHKQLLPRTVARALFNFQGQSARELSFKKGDIIYIRRQIDRNWYEGEHNAMLGLLPVNYVEIISKDGVRCPPKPKPAEGQARAKYNFNAQSAIELSLNKGELVKLTRRVDDNWFEGRVANRKGIFPVAYVEVLTDIGSEDAHMVLSKPVGSPAAHSLITPTQEITPYTRETRFELEAPVVGENGVIREMKTVKKTEVLHVDTNSDPIPYRALYKYRPQNPDEMEMEEGDIVYVLEKCDDGWFVGTSQRTGCFGTFPGNYVEKL
ncbi:sorbin and SH3 domain-containing protein 1 isoform X34 [Lutzomyia longipalpis]|uniref:sorbin and SH3 domain-containing protein 1 isoform X34 n=1 Tax=Lutzomyia longipalpis TaxID=7200 RepID=UPI002483BDF3|nr:sorbin and SH3 domain-containing protein 1 isoform X34 [Lutzomyia longipalpis]